MKPEVIYFDNEVEWLAFRQTVLGASEVSSLFGFGYQTIYQLWNIKAGKLDRENLNDSLPVMVGKFMEQGLKEVIQHFKGVELRKSKRYLKHPELRLGCSLDYEQLDPEFGWVPAETKIIDWTSFQDWEETEWSGEYDPPLKFSLQLQTQMMITNKPIGHLYALVGNNQLVHVRQDADPEIQDLIKSRVIAFWNSIDSNDPPPVDYHKDLQAMYAVMNNVDNGRELSVFGDEFWEENVAAYKLASDREKAAKEIKDELRGKILEAMGPAIRAKCNAGTISAKNREYHDKVIRSLRITPRR